MHLRYWGQTSVPDNTVHITPTRGGFSKLDFSTTKRVPTTNDTSSERSRQIFSNADMFGMDAVPTVDISTTKNRPRGGVISTVVYGRKGETTRPRRERVNQSEWRVSIKFQYHVHLKRGEM